MDHRAAAEHSGLPQAVRLAMNAPIASTSGVARTLSRLRLPLLMCVSGFASLTYQMVWTAQGALWIGHESAAVLAVITAFFGGLAVGGLAFGKLAQHSANPTRWYGACELCIAAWGCILLAVGAHFQAGLQTLLESPAENGFPWLTTFLLMFLWLLPATTAMGATLPAMQRLGSRRADGWHSLPELYACNTFGAVLGVLLPTFWLIPQFGFTRTLQVCIALNLACAASPLFLTNRDPTHGSSSHLGIGAITKSPEPESAWPHYITLAVTGFLGIAYEVLVVRVLSQVTEDTVYTFALLLSVYLVGTAVGAGAYQRFAATSLVTPARLRIRLLGATASACLVGTTSLWQSNWIRDTASSALGSSFPAAIATEALLAGCAFGPAAVAQGALFSHLSQSLIGAGANFGVALGMNTLAGSLAPILAGVVMATALGSKASLLWVAIGYVLLARPWGSARRELALWVPAACAMGLAVFAPPLSFLEVPEGGRVVSHEEGVMAAVSVVEDARGVARLSINNRQQEGSSASALVDARQAWIPLLLHPHPRRALFLGLGTGVTARAASRDQNLEVDAVELLPEVIEAAHHFRSENDPAGKPRVFEADARRYIRSSRSTYDVIVSDNFHPARSGSGALYTVEHFAAVRRVLNERGLFCQWLPLHQLDLDTLRSIVQSFVSVYPRSWALLANNSLETPVLGLLTKADQTRLDLTLIR
ncbi:MAG TPA: fused MFS/spermidine synthase, partial [Polyangiaceae bacterium]|nr:fused MFS/spermidine synthase [Polyangiaceae bacterium]